MDVRLVLDQGRDKRQTWHLHHTETVVGRRRDCDLRIPAAEVSRRHCLLSITDGYVIVEDLDSVNGTFINGRRVVGKQVLRPGDHLEIGPLDFTVEYELTPSALERLAMREGKPEQAEELEALPLAEEDVEADTTASQERDRSPAVQENNIIRDPNDPPAFLDEGEAANWHLPPSNELRDLLSQLEEPQPKLPRRRD